MMFGLDSFNLIKEFTRVSNESNVEQLANNSVRLQPYLKMISECTTLLNNTLEIVIGRPNFLKILIGRVIGRPNFLKILIGRVDQPEHYIVQQFWNKTWTVGENCNNSKPYTCFVVLTYDCGVYVCTYMVAFICYFIHSHVTALLYIYFPAIDFYFLLVAKYNIRLECVFEATGD